MLIIIIPSLIPAVLEKSCVATPLGFYPKHKFSNNKSDFRIFCNWDKLRIFKSLKSQFILALKFFPQVIAFFSHFTKSSKRKSGHTFNTLHGNLLR